MIARHLDSAGCCAADPDRVVTVIKKKRVVTSPFLRESDPDVPSIRALSTRKNTEVQIAISKALVARSVRDYLRRRILSSLEFRRRRCLGRERWISFSFSFLPPQMPMER